MAGDADYSYTPDQVWGKPPKPPVANGVYTPPGGAPAPVNTASDSYGWVGNGLQTGETNPAFSPTNGAAMLNLNSGLANAGYSGPTTATAFTPGDAGSSNTSIAPQFQSWLDTNNYSLSADPAKVNGMGGVSANVTDASGNNIANAQGASNDRNAIWAIPAIAGGMFGASAVLGNGSLAASGAEAGAGASSPFSGYASFNPAEFSGLVNTGAAGASTGASDTAALDALMGGSGADLGLGSGAFAAPNALAPVATAGGIGGALDSVGSFIKQNPQLASAGLAGAFTLANGSGGNMPTTAPATGPNGTIAAQAAANLTAAQQQAQLNRVDINNPYGSVTNQAIADPSVPGGYRYVQNTTLSPGQQTLFNNNQSSQISQSQLLDALTKSAGGSLSTPLDFSSVPGLKTSAGDPTSYYQQAADAMYQKQTQYLDPQVAQQQQALEARLAEQGFVPGTPGYQQAMQNFQDTNARAYAAARDSAIGQGITAGQNLFQNNLSNANLNNNASSETLAQLLQKRAQPLNELNSLRTGTQVTVPNAPTPSQVNNPAVDTVGANNTAYNQQLGQYNANVASSNSTNAALSQLALALGMYLG